MAYVDGFVLPVPTKNLTAYKKMSKLAGKVWMDHGQHKSINVGHKVLL